MSVIIYGVISYHVIQTAMQEELYDPWKLDYKRPIRGGDQVT